MQSRAVRQSGTLRQRGPTRCMYTPYVLSVAFGLRRNIRATGIMLLLSFAMIANLLHCGRFLGCDLRVLEVGSLSASLDCLSHVLNELMGAILPDAPASCYGYKVLVAYVGAVTIYQRGMLSEKPGTSGDVVGW